MKPESARVHVFPLEAGWTARVGRSDADNDVLTFQEAFPQDLWLHVAGSPGSHVVLHHAGDRDPPRAVLEAAGQLAVRYSKSKNAKQASVTVARICDLQKPRGAPAGQVTVRRHKTLRIRMPEAQG